MFVLHLLTLEFHLLERALRHRLIFFCTGCFKLQFDEVDLRKTAALGELFQTDQQIAVAIGLLFVKTELAFRL